MQHYQHNSTASCSQDYFPGPYSSSSRSHTEVSEPWPTDPLNLTFGLPMHHENSLASIESQESPIFGVLSVLERSPPAFQTSRPVFETSLPTLDDCSQKKLENLATISKSLSSWPASNTCSRDDFRSNVRITDTPANLAPPSAISTRQKTPAKLQSISSDCIRCWQHGCGGRSFSNVSNYRRHCKEKSEHRTKASCPWCGQRFSRTAARDLHTSQERCQITLLDANGIPFRQKLTQALPAELVETDNSRIMTA